jgi:hypothetical protein
MRNRIVVNKPDTINNQNINRLYNLQLANPDNIRNNPVFEILSAEGGENFYCYIEWLGLGKDQNIVILPSVRHYYYEEEELKNVTTVVNIKQLNQIRNLDSFLQSLSLIISKKSNFVGCFAENSKNYELTLNIEKTAKDSDPISVELENGIISRFPLLNRIYNIMDSKTNRPLTREYVNLRFATYGFEILAMNSLNGLTYFLANKALNPVA